jgi:hypothetical protein
VDAFYLQDVATHLSYAAIEVIAEF